MLKFKRYFSFYISSFVACLFMVVTSGCVSGGFKLTRQYARWVNSKSIILRIILYIFTSIVFAVTLLIDSVIFNTMDFWEGKVSSGSYEFQEAGKSYFVQHDIDPKTKLKSSNIRIFNGEKVLLQTVLLQEKTNGKLEMFVDGKLRTKVDGIYDIPVASIFDKTGKLVQTDSILSNKNLAYK